MPLFGGWGSPIFSILLYFPCFTQNKKQNKKQKTKELIFPSSLCFLLFSFNFASTLHPSFLFQVLFDAAELRIIQPHNEKEEVWFQASIRNNLITRRWIQTITICLSTWSFCKCKSIFFFCLFNFFMLYRRVVINTNIDL